MQNLPCDNEFYLQEIKKIHINGVTLTLVLKQRHGAACLAMLLLCIFARRFSWSRGLCDDYGTAEENLLNNQPFSFFFIRLVRYQKAARRWVRECLLMHDSRLALSRNEN